MPNLWNIKNINANKNPIPILEEQGKVLLDLTHNKVGTSITTTNDKKGNFVITFLITSPLMPNYSFKVFSITCTPVLYPLTIACDENIGKELGFYPPNLRTICHDNDEFLDFLSRVLGSDYISQVVGSIMSLANSYMPL